MRQGILHVSQDKNIQYEHDPLLQCCSMGSGTSARVATTIILDDMAPLYRFGIVPAGNAERMRSAAVVNG